MRRERQFTMTLHSICETMNELDRAWRAYASWVDQDEFITAEAEYGVSLRTWAFEAAGLNVVRQFGTNRLSRKSAGSGWARIDPHLPTG